MAKIVFFGTPQFAREVLERVAQTHQIVGVVTQPDRPFGRKQILKPSSVKEYALLHSLPLFQPQRLESSLLQELLELKPDFFLVVAFGQIFPKIFLDALPCVNLHASLLPKFRGASPMQEMILCDQQEYAITAMQMQEGLDTGEILGVSVWQGARDLSLSLLAQGLAELGGRLARKVLSEFASIAPLPQIACEASVCKKIKKEAGCVRFENAREIYLKYLAYGDWPSIFLPNGLKLLEIAQASLEGSYQEGEILQITSKSVIVGCVCGAIEIFAIQPPSKSKMQVLDYLRGKRYGIGDIFC